MPLHFVPVWVRLTCGGCSGFFVGNARTVPQWSGSPACPRCWERANDLRAQLGFFRWDLPVDAYPDPDSPDPAVNGSQLTPSNY